ncbi:uncharacterized protein PG998_011736 [Apiospora kogelbergensis]|uniref:uncharacterized protein n=1 Tax=Apiospora kogelbergensis TaxID=1337665 RepID=UPI003130AADC
MLAASSSPTPHAEEAGVMAQIPGGIRPTPVRQRTPPYVRHPPNADSFEQRRETSAALGHYAWEESQIEARQTVCFPRLEVAGNLKSIKRDDGS